MHLLVAIVVISVPVLGDAKPLPSGMTLKIKDNHVVVKDRDVQVILDDVSLDKLGKIELSDDGARILIAASDTCYGGATDSDGKVSIPLAKVQAKLENLRGMMAHLKKRFADAIPHFAAAVKLDPDLPLYATNLLSAQSLGGRLADADQTLATAAPRNVPWFVWRLQVDADLKPLAGRAATKLVTVKRGTATSKALHDEVAYSPLGLVATEVWVGGMDGVPDGSETDALEIVDIKTGAELLRLPTENTCAVDIEAASRGVTPAPAADAKCPAKEAAAAAPRRRVADAVLATLGFNLVPNQHRSLIDDGGKDSAELSAPDGRRFVNSDVPHVSIAKHADVPVGVNGKPFYAGFVPGAFVVWYRTYKHIDGCAADGPYDMALAPFATP